MSGRSAIVGNSFVGAVMKALQNDPDLARGNAIDFAASAGGTFAEIAIAEGRFVNIRRSEQFAVRPVSDYDAFFIYGLFPSPHAVDKLYHRLTRARYSKQVIATTIDEFLTGSEAHIVYRRIKAAVAVPVHILSANTPTYFGAIGAEDYRRSLALIRATVGGDYIETPPELFTAELAPNDKLYKGSVNINGQQLGERQARHDYNHLNPQGGAIILDAMMDRLDRSVSPTKAGGIRLAG